MSYPGDQTSISPVTLAVLTEGSLCHCQAGLSRAQQVSVLPTEQAGGNIRLSIAHGSLGDFASVYVAACEPCSSHPVHVEIPSEVINRKRPGRMRLTRVQELSGKQNCKLVLKFTDLFQNR